MMWLSIVTFLTIVGLATVVTWIINFVYKVIRYFTTPVHLDALDRIGVICDEMAMSTRNT
jgi:hypothetical protein